METREAPLSQARFGFDQLTWLFPTPLMSYSIEEAERINVGLLEEIATRRKAEGGVVRSNRKGWHSESDFFTRPEPIHAELARAIHGAAGNATMRVAQKGLKPADIAIDIMGWVNVNPPGAHNVPHEHPGSLWSGCYYVTNDAPQGDPSGGGSILFIDARAAPAGQPLVKAPSFKTLQAFHPKPGTLLLFPSSLKHLVAPNDSDRDRVTIAFNVFVFQRPAGARGGS